MSQVVTESDPDPVTGPVRTPHVHRADGKDGGVGRVGRDGSTTAPIAGLPTGPVDLVARALRLAGVLGFVAQFVIITFQLGTFALQAVRLGDGVLPATGTAVVAAVVRFAQLAAVVTLLACAWSGRRRAVRAAVAVIVVMSVVRLVMQLPAALDTRSVVAWLAASTPLWGASLVTALGFRGGAPVDGAERELWLRSAPVGVLLLGLLVALGPVAPVPHAWTLLYGLVLVALLVGAVVVVRRGSAVTVATTSCALSLLALFVLPIQVKDLVVPVEGRSPLVLAAEVVLTVGAAFAGWAFGNSRLRERP
jgi:hypothetical protein